MIHFASKIELEEKLTAAIATHLKTAITERGKATLLLSGGSTPGGVYRLLSQVELNWSKVVVGLVDERFVGPDSEFSNHLLIQNTLLRNKAQVAQFVPMVSNPNDYAKNLEEIEDAYRIFTEPDVVLLGMGPDGHTASIFPNDAASDLALHGKSQLIFNTNAPAHPTQRITCSAALLCRSRNLLLMLTGAQKLTVFEMAATNNLPIAAFQNHIDQIYYTAS